MMNWVLLISTIWLVVSFKSSSNLAAAYGLAVTGTMVITTVLAYFVARRNWGWSRLRGLAIVSVFLVIDMAFFGANLVKIPEGGWFPLLAGGIMYFFMATWQRGRAIVAARMRSSATPLAQFVRDVERLQPLHVPGVAIFMTSDSESTPPALLHNLKHNKIMHERVALLTIITTDDPYVRGRDRTVVTNLAPDF